MWKEETLFSVLRNYLRITRTYLCTFVLFAKFMFHSKTHIQRKMLGRIRSRFKVSPPNSKSKYPKGPKPRQRFKPKAPSTNSNLFFFFWESSTSIDSPQTSYTHMSYRLLPSPFQFTRCVLVSHNHTPTFLNERWGWIRLWVTFALDVSRCSPKLSKPSSPFIQLPNKGLNLPFHVLCSTNKFWTARLPSFFGWDNVNLRLVGLNCWKYYTK